MVSNPTHYFVYIGQSTKPKNTLQYCFKEYLIGFRGLLVRADRVEIIKQKIKDRSAAMNEKYSRCTPLKIDFTERYNGDGYSLSGFEFLQFNILEAIEYE